jgi:hypothetical protein
MIRIVYPEDINRLLENMVLYGSEDMQEAMLKAASLSYLPKPEMKNGAYVARVRIKNDYGFQFLYDLETERHHNFIANGYIVHNSGKDITAWNLVIREAIQRVGSYFYCLPTFSQARLVIFDSITNDGHKFLDYIPRKLIKSINQQQMKITLINNSIIQLIGSNNYDTCLVGTNPRMIIFSEWSLSDARVYQYVRPIMNANNGICLFLSTPRGYNHFYELYQIASNSKEWFCYKLTVDDCGHISNHDIQKEIISGEISEDLAQQEYYCSFASGVEGSYYSKYIDKMKLKGQIGSVPVETGFLVNTAWDIGVRDSTVIIFYQCIGTTVRIVDYYENSKQGLDHYAAILESKDYLYGKHIAPHDIAVREWGSGQSRIEAARALGIKFTLSNNVSLMDGIESCRAAFSRIYIDEVKCKVLIRNLENYRQEYDSRRKVYCSRPLHDKCSHSADALRYLCVSLPKTRDGLSADELSERFNKSQSRFTKPNIW